MNKKIVVLGLGNILCGDDGFGVHVCHILQQNFSFPPECAVIDGGTQGQLLYGIVEEASKLLIIDAARLGLSPGSIALRQKSEIPTWLTSSKLSAHQSSFAEVLALASLKGILTPTITLIGFQPVTLEFGAHISKQGRACLPIAAGMALDILAEWGIRAVKGANQDLGFVGEAARSFLECSYPD